MSDTEYVCEECFYSNSLNSAVHQDLLDQTCLCPWDHDSDYGVVQVSVTRHRGRLCLELPERPLPGSIPSYVPKARLCESIRNKEQCGWGERCRFAHSFTEQRNWTAQLQLRRERNHGGGGYAAGHERFVDRIKEELDLSVIQAPLERANYQKKFHNLLCWEEKHHIELLEEKCTHNRCSLNLYDEGFKPPWLWSSRYRHGHRYGFIDKMTPDQIAYATQASEAACFVDASGNREARAVIVKTDSSFTDDRLYISFEADQLEILKLIHRRVMDRRVHLTNIMVQFEVKHLYFDNLTRAVNAINPEIIAKLVPTSVDQFKPKDSRPFPPPNARHINRQISKLHDEGKRNALRAMVKCNPKSPPLLINGSFGTGKTRVLAIGAYCFIELGKVQSQRPTRVLICAHHQASADQLVESYFGQMIDNEGWRVKLIRLASSHFFVHGHYSQYYQKVFEYRKKRELEQVKQTRSLVIATTFLTSIHLSQIHPPGFFTHILIDEGAQSREPEALAVLSLASNNTKIVIVGDSCQVGPNLLVLGKEARKYGLKESLLSRLQKRYKELGGFAEFHSLTINTNYRCHEDILAIPHKLFYDNLVCNAQNAKPHHLAPYPLLFVCSSTCSLEGAANVDAEMEAEILLEEVLKYSNDWPIAWGPHDLQNMCIVTASRTQLVKTRKLVKSRQKFKALNGIRMLPTYDIQGQEFQALFLSTIETIDPEGNSSNPTKSPCDRYVFNTVLTRAKSLVVVVGSPLVLLGIEKHMVKLYGEKGKCWNLYISSCLKRKTLTISDTLIKKEGISVEKQNKFIKTLRRECGLPEADLPQPASVARRSLATPLKVKGRNNPSGLATPATKPKTKQPNTQPPTRVWTVEKQQLRHSPERKKSSPARSSKQGAQGYSQSHRMELGDFITHSMAAKLTSTAGKKSSQKNLLDYYEENKDKLDENILKQSLTRNNYREKFHQLLCWEEKEHEEKLGVRCNGREYEVTFYQRGFEPDTLEYDSYNVEKFVCYGHITAATSDADILAYAKQASEGCFIFLDEATSVKTKHVFAFPPKKYELNESSAIVFALTNDEEQKLFRTKRNRTNILKVNFELKHSYFRGLHNAIEMLPNIALAKILPDKQSFPTDSSDTTIRFRKPPWCVIRDFDYGQLEALSSIMRCSPKVPVLLVGPFGTGKTRLLARAAYEILKQSRNNRVLVCAHHQASVDTFIEYFGEMKQDEEYEWFVKFVRVTPSGSYNSQTKYKYEEFYETRKSVSNLLKYQLVITTLGTAHHLKNRILFKPAEGFFTHILIDEGAQTREPETLGPLCFAGKYTKIVIAGDHCQVGPKLLVFGDKPQQYGLGTSLLERLHKLYKDIGKVTEGYSSSLLTNYRCHSGILMLPSNLFYASTLQCRVNDSESHHLAPYPLLFYCSSFRNVTSHSKSTDEEEAKALLDVVLKFCSSWPKGDWGEKPTRENLRKLCIMSPSPNQCSLIRAMMKSKPYDTLKGIEILKAYDIQGREFRAIFIGTTEVTSDEGESMNPTKSLCDPFVFNTAITRSQSLVVAVGNPFLLLSIEANMVKKYEQTGDGDRAKCWSQYMKRCLECNTFHILKSPRKPNPPDLPALRDHLYKKVFSDSAILHYPISTGNSERDSILRAYSDALNDNPAFKKLKLSLFDPDKAKIEWNLGSPKKNATKATEDEDKRVKLSKKTFQCILNCINYREADAVPLDANNSVVKIKGSKNRIGAFDGDTVEVGVFEDSPEGKCYGKVLCEPMICDRPGDERNFLCRVFHKNPIVFCPVDRKNPNFYNLPRLTREMLSKHNKEVLEDELKSTDVVVFNPTSIEDIQKGTLPQIQNVIPLSVAKNMLFIVTFVQWNTNYRSPLGIAIRAIPKGTTAFRAERLLTLQHKVEYNDYSLEVDAVDITRDPSVPLFDRAFTIDPEDAKNLDDALSLIHLPKQNPADSSECVYELSVHIVNVAKHIAPSSEEDKFARHVGTSVYGGTKGKIMHMLPAAKKRRQLSLIPNCVRDVISVVARVTIDGDLVQIDEPKVKVAQIKSIVQLTYGNAQEIMDDKKVTKETNPQDGMDKYDSSTGTEQPSLSETLRLLYKIAFCMRKERLKEAGTAAYCYDINDEEDTHCWQTHLLIGELMIWANSTVAKMIHHSFPDCALLRCQRPPNDKALESFASNNQKILSHSCALSHLLPSADEDSDDLMIPRNTLANLQRAISQKDTSLLTILITSDRYYPQLAAAHSQMRSNYQRAEYCCTDKDKPPSEYRHYSLCLDDYTHFTSPMRRYIDIVVQRMISEMLTSSRHLNTETFVKNDHRMLCQSLNVKYRNAGQFQKSMSKVSLAIKFASSSEIYDVFVSRVNKGSIELFIPDLELNCMSQREMTIRLRNIGPFSNQSGDSSVTLHWKFKMTSMKEEQGMQVLQQSSLHLEKMPNESSSPIYLEVLCSKPKSEVLSSKSNSDIAKSTKSTLTKQEYSASLHVSEVSSTPEHVWKKALEFVKNPTDDNMMEFKHILPDVPALNTATTGCPSDVISPFIYYKLKLDLNTIMSLKVWMTWAMREAHISPVIQVVELTPGLRICVQHNAHPAECFSDQNLSKVSRKKYPNIQEYIKLWEKVLLAEAAEKTVKECQPVIIQDVQLVWPELTVPSNCIDGVYYTTGEKSVVMNLPQHFVENCSEFFKINVGDLICARYGTDPHAGTRAVFHMVVHEIEEKKGIVHMKFIGENNCKLSERMKELVEQTCEVQLISLSKSYQRVYHSLLQLDKKKKKPSRVKQKTISELVSQVALGSIDHDCPVNDQNYVDLTTIISTEEEARILWKERQKTLNRGQINALELTLKRKFRLIQGPPGTGKSETGAHIAYVFAMANKKVSPHHSVLYCGPSNKSVDVVLRKLDMLKSNNPNPQAHGSELRILRIYSRSVEEKHFPSPRKNQTESSESGYDVNDKETKKLVEKYSLHFKLRESDVGAALSGIEEELSKLPEGEIADGKMCIDYHNALVSAEKDFLKNNDFDIVLCTCNEAAGSRMEYVSPRQCIIDECGMATEPESIAPISLCEHVVLIGDHKQLQPVIDYNQAKDSGLAISLFERYAERLSGFTTLLKTQYRMHEAICKFPSNEFYDEKLETDRSVKERVCRETKLRFWPGPEGAECPILFVNVVGEEGQSETGRQGEKKVGIDSKSNLKEAKKVVELVRVLRHVHKLDKKDQIAVLTPYSAQRELIKKEMIKNKDLVIDGDSKSAKKKEPAVKVASITESQGDEYGIVVLSTVRSQLIEEIKNPHHIQPDRSWLMENLGFITDRHQINVGITRSKYGLVIVGNKMLLKYDVTWKNLIDHYTKRECVVEGNKFPNSQDLAKLP